jgi:hypothetical protein
LSLQIDEFLIIRKQIALAGYRLANIIKTIPIVQVRRSLTYAQVAGIAIGIFFVGMFLGGVLIYATPKKQDQRSTYTAINT